MLVYPREWVFRDNLYKRSIQAMKGHYIEEFPPQKGGNSSSAMMYCSGSMPLPVGLVLP